MYIDTYSDLHVQHLDNQTKCSNVYLKARCDYIQHASDKIIHWWSCIDRYLYGGMQRFAALSVFPRAAPTDGTHITLAGHS